MLLTATVASLSFCVILLKKRSGKRRQKILALSAFCFVVALLSGSLFWQDVAEDAAAASQTGFEQTLQIISDSKNGAISKTSVAAAKSETGRTVNVRIFWNDNDQVLPKGSWLKANLSFAPLKENQDWLLEQGICGSATITNPEALGFDTTIFGRIDSFRASNVAVINSIDTSGSALLSGILLGNREALAGTAVEQDFRTCGLSHLIAVSGSHLAIVAALFTWLLMRLPGNRKIELLVLSLTLMIYVVLTGLQPSAIRAAVMAATAGFSFFVGRRGHAPSALCTAAIIMLVAYPANAFSVGFWLSVSAVFGISLFANFNQSWLEAAVFANPNPNHCSELAHKAKVLAAKKQRKFFEPVSSAIALTVSATLATMPLSIPMFAMFSLISPLANLIVGPLVSVILIVGILVLCLGAIFPSIIYPACTAISWVGDFIAWLAARLASLPFASIPADISMTIAIVLAIVIAVLIYLIWPEPNTTKARMIPMSGLAICLIFVIVSPWTTAPQMVMMDIGQGDAILIKEGSNAVLIDTGASDTALMRALARNRITSLNAVVITHLDSDHYGALARLRGATQVDNIYFANGLLKSQSNAKAINDAYAIAGKSNTLELTAGDILQIGKSISLQMVWPIVPAREGKNPESICMLLVYDQQNDGIPEYQALLTGDAEQNEIDGILNNNPLLTADIYKVGHHGSKQAVTLPQLQSLGSKYALISVGANNRYGHPTTETLSVLEQAGCKIFRTDLNGDVSLKFSGSDMILSCATISQEIY
ncbi:hypothetical protein FACS1894104_2180 [Actinomycetota bacterium]|nr:hypothetical protein FACS1894104_2180 [Actinomycetota bacterium]